MLQWNEMYETGFDSVDSQHKKLFSMVNDFEKSIKNQTAQNTINETLRFLGSYVQTHFRDEEKCMNEYHCPSAEKNANAHREFLEVYTGFVGRFKSQGYSDALAKKLHKTAESWLIKHICGVDFQLKLCINRKH